MNCTVFLEKSSPSADVFLPALLETAGEGSAYDERAPLQCGATLALAAPGSALDGFRVTSSFLMDTGCGSDLISEQCVLPFGDRVCQTDTVRFTTANGISETSKSIPLVIGPLNTLAEPCVLPSTPSVSVGRQALPCRVSHFFGLQGRFALFGHADTPHVVPLDVCRDIPYLLAKREAQSDRSRPRRACMHFAAY